jgi:hypothetical protein
MDGRYCSTDCLKEQLAPIKKQSMQDMATAKRLLIFLNRNGRVITVLCASNGTPLVSLNRFMTVLTGIPEDAPLPHGSQLTEKGDQGFIC